MSYGVITEKVEAALKDAGEPLTEEQRYLVLSILVGFQISIEQNGLEEAIKQFSSEKLSK